MHSAQVLMTIFPSDLCPWLFERRRSLVTISVYVVSHPRYSTTWKSPLIILMTARHQPQDSCDFSMILYLICYSHIWVTGGNIWQKKWFWIIIRISTVTWSLALLKTSISSPSLNASDADPEAGAGGGNLTLATGNLDSGCQSRSNLSSTSVDSGNTSLT